ncbi:mediator of RNA polymerase II transcription subunit 13 [Haplosporangium sp. Z 11]|nr:mediator of RNA polymerase II transcription subunit 13 [Haplosporangium sp. Z 11]
MPESGIMTWDAILQQNTSVSVETPQTPKSSTASTATVSPTAPVAASQEYENFISGLRNVLDRTMLSCTVTMYLSSTNLIFQPAFQYHRLRTLNAIDLDPRYYAAEKELPAATLKLKDMAEFSEEQVTQCLDGWKAHFGTNQEVVQEISLSLPRLVAVSVKSGPNEVLLQYPTERVYVPLSCKESPSDVGHLDGMGSRNLGFIEDLGAKFALWSWQEKTRNAIASPAVPKLIPPVSEHTPVLAEPRNRLKAGSSAWQQQQHQLQQQLLQQQQHQQMQQQQQSFFLQQQQEALERRKISSAQHDTNRIDYWSYTDPYTYLTSIVLNSCANVEPKSADSPSATDNQTLLVAPVSSTKTSKTKFNSNDKTIGSVEADGWMRKRPKKNTAVSDNTPSFISPDISDIAQSTWNNGPGSGSMQASDIGPSFNSPSQFTNGAKVDAAQTDAQSTSASANTSSYHPIDIPVDNSDMMSGLMDMNSMLGLYGNGNSDDLDDWGEVTKDDFDYFNKQPPSAAASRSLPMTSSVAFDSQSLQSSIPNISTSMTVNPETTSAIATTDGLMAAFADMSDPFAKMVTTESPMNDDNLFANMDLDLMSFAQPTPTSSAIMSMGVSEKLTAITSGTMELSPSGDQFLLNQLPQGMGILTPAPQASMTEKDSSGQPQSQLQTQQHLTPQQQMQPMTQLEIITAERSSVKRPSILVQRVHSPVQSFIPLSFAPLKIVGDYFVDESKYQAGGRYVYKRLYKRRKSSIRDPYLQYYRESKMLPFYQPGKDQEWVMPVRKDKARKAKSRQFSVGFNWNALKVSDASKIISSSNGSPMTVKQESEGQNYENDKSLSLATALATPATWGTSSSSSLPTQLYQEQKREDEGSSSESDSDSSSESSSEESDVDSSSPSRSPCPTFGTLSRQSNSNNGATTSWSARNVDSAKFVTLVITGSESQNINAALLGMKSRVGGSSRISYSDADADGRVKAWPSKDAYHSEVEFDTPFTPAIMSAAPPSLVEEPLTVQELLASEYFLEAVKTLCEQTILGDYPFAGANEVTGTSGEISEGESFHVMLARRKTMIQYLHRGVATVPALGDESFKNVLEMKTILYDIFDRLRGNPSESTVALPVPSEASQEMALSMGHHHRSSQSNITPPVVMKGPLTLFQYFTLAEVQQMSSKYGKYQVKKKKPAEPALVQLQPPDIVVGHNDEWLEAAPTILRFWEKLSLEPYSSKKSIVYFVIYPEGVDMENVVSRFWRELSAVFETSLLGKHQPGTLQNYKPGLVPIPLLPPLAGETMEARQVRSYVDGCQRLGSLLGSNSSNRDVHTVVYMVNPFSHGAGYFDLCRCFSIMKTQFRTAALGSLLTPLEQQRERLVLQMVPIQHVLYPLTFGGYLRFGLKDIAFTVYTKCKMFLERPVYFPGMMAQINAYAPSFALAKTIPPTIHFDVGQKPNSMPKLLGTLHVGYGFSLDGRWLVCVWTDHRGEMLEHMALDMKNETDRITMTAQSNNNNNNNNNNSGRDADNNDTNQDQLLLSSLQEIWTRTWVYQKRGSFKWKTVICKLGLMAHVELQEWIRLAEGTEHTSIVAVNIDSPLRMYHHSHGAELSSPGMVLSASGVNTPTGTGHILQMPLGGSSSTIASTPLTQSMLPNATATSTPDASVGPATPISNNGNSGGLNSASGTGLGIAGASGVATGGSSQATGSGAMGGIGGLSGNETLENSAGEVYAMILNHRMPLIVSRQEAGLDGVVSTLSRKSNSSVASAGQPLEDAEDGEIRSSDVKMEEKSHLSTPMADPDPGQDQDQDMEPKIKDEERNHEVRKSEPTPSSSSPAIPQGNDVILPLSTGYLIQVPIQSNSVNREKHCLEALGVEVHLLHLQCKSTTSTATASTPGVGSGTPSTGALLASYNQQSPYPQQQHSTAYHLQRHNPTSPSTPGGGFPTNRPTSTFPNTQFPGSSPSMSSPSSTFLGGTNNTLAGPTGAGTGASAGGATTIKATVAANTTREILKQFHALSYLSMTAPVQTNCLPHHLILVERLSRVLLLVQD